MAEGAELQANPTTLHPQQSLRRGSTTSFTGSPMSLREGCGLVVAEEMSLATARQGAPGSAATPGAELQPEHMQFASSPARGERSMCAGRADPH